MSISKKLHTRLEKAIMPVVEVCHALRLSNWLWIVSGILQSRSLAEERQSESLVFVPSDCSQGESVGFEARLDLEAMTSTEPR